MAERLSPEDLRIALDTLEGWDTVDGRDAIERSFRFKSFREAFGISPMAYLRARRLNAVRAMLKNPATADLTVTGAAMPPVMSVASRMSSPRR